MNKMKLEQIVNNIKNVKYIKLGPGDIWAKDSIEKGYVAFGYHRIVNDTQKNYSLNGITSEIENKYYSDRDINSGVKGAITNHARQVNDFVNSDEKTLWITFYRQEMYWTIFDYSIYCYDINNKDEEEPSRKRNLLVGRWYNTSIDGENRFNLEYLRGDLTKTKGYRGTICDIANVEYVKKIILNHLSKNEQEAHKAYRMVVEHVRGIIKGLNEEDFELFIDLICSRSGMSRIGSIGGMQRGIDMQYESILVDGEIAVQVKSELDKRLAKDLIDNFGNGNSTSSTRFIIAHHGPEQYYTEEIEGLCRDIGRTDLVDCITIWNTADLAKYAINYGLYDWLKKRFL